MATKQVIYLESKMEQKRDRRIILRPIRQAQGLCETPRLQILILEIVQAKNSIYQRAAIYQINLTRYPLIADQRQSLRAIRLAVIAIRDYRTSA